MKYKIAEALSIEAESASPRFRIYINRDVVHENGADRVAESLRAAFGERAKHTPSLSPQGGLDRFEFTADTAAARPALAREVLKNVAPVLTDVFKSLGACLATVCRYGCHDPILPGAIEPAVKAIEALDKPDPHQPR